VEVVNVEKKKRGKKSEVIRCELQDEAVCDYPKETSEEVVNNVKLDVFAQSFVPQKKNENYQLKTDSKPVEDKPASPITQPPKKIRSIYELFLEEKAKIILKKYEQKNSKEQLRKERHTKSMKLPYIKLQASNPVSQQLQELKDQVNRMEEWRETLVKRVNGEETKQEVPPREEVENKIDYFIKTMDVHEHMRRGEGSKYLRHLGQNITFWADELCRIGKDLNILRDYIKRKNENNGC
jgi:hypothetical protein